MRTIRVLLLVVILWNITDFFMLRDKKSCYVDVSKVYEGFDMKKDYEKMVTQQNTLNKNKVDSLEFDLQQMSLRISGMDSIKQRESYRSEISAFMMKRNKYMQIKNSLEYKYKGDVQAYDEKIWKQINAAITEFGKENGYDYIFGAMGNGNMMYASEGDNVTDAFLSYLNKKYKDG